MVFVLLCAGVGMAINIFSSITRLFNAPLLAVTTSAVAAASAEGEREDCQHAKAAAVPATAAAAEEAEEAEEEEEMTGDASLKQPLLQHNGSSKGSSQHSRLSAAVSAAIILALSFSFVEVRMLVLHCFVCLLFYILTWSKHFLTSLTCSF
jgi:hypothetical protein